MEGGNYMDKALTFPVKESFSPEEAVEQLLLICEGQVQYVQEWTSCNHDIWPNFLHFPESGETDTLERTVHAAGVYNILSEERLATHSVNA